MNLKSILLAGLVACNIYASPCNSILEEMGELNFLIQRLTEELQESPDYQTMIDNLNSLYPDATDTDIDNFCFGHDSCSRIYFVENDLNDLSSKYLECLNNKERN
jgi:hypothetical protein